MVEYCVIKMCTGKRGPRNLINIQGLSPLGQMHPNKEEVRQKCQEAFKDEQGVSGQIQAQKHKPAEGGSKEK